MKLQAGARGGEKDSEESPRKMVFNRLVESGSFLLRKKTNPCLQE